MTYKYSAHIADGGPRGGAAVQLWLRSGGVVDDPLHRLTFSLEVLLRREGWGLCVSVRVCVCGCLCLWVCDRQGA